MNPARPLIGLTLLFAGCAVDREGSECSDPGSFDCDAVGQIWFCDEGTWTTEQPQDTGSEHCTCNGIEMSCAVPGFVGLDRAGRVRKAGQRLRRG